MPTTVYRRKSLVVTATQSPTGNWLVDEGGQRTVYTPRAFEALFDKLEMQSDMAEPGADTDMFGFDYSWCEGIENRGLLNELLGIEAISIDNSIDGQSWMFKPYPLSTFGRLLKAVCDDMKHTWGVPFTESAPLFVEVGCGVGTKLALAQKMFGLKVSGFDYNQDYCNATSELLYGKGCESWTIQRLDARSRDAVELYKTADVLYLNRPFVHLDLQAELEKLALHSMRRGAYIILGNYAADPEKLRQRGWREITQDKVAIVLQKP